MTQVFKVSKPNQNVLSGTVPNNFYLDTNYPLLKVHSFSTFSMLQSATISHNLGYYPFVLTFSNFVDSNLGVPVISSNYYQHDWYLIGASLENVGRTKIYTDKIIIDVYNSDAPLSGTQRVKGFYYIFKDPIV